MYRLQNNFNGIVRITDNRLIGNHPGNPDWEAYLKWVSEGNTPYPDETVSIRIEGMKRVITKHRDALQAAFICTDSGFPVKPDQETINLLNSLMTYMKLTSEKEAVIATVGGLMRVTYNDVVDIFKEIQRTNQAFAECLKTHIDTLEKLDDLSDIQLYNYSSGWPE